MKNQYFGDVNDYRKYGILRSLSNVGGLSLGICWMLTPNDGRNDGGFVGYVCDPGRWREFDPELFDAMRASLAPDCLRSVGQASDLGFLNNALFHDPILCDDGGRRRGYFACAAKVLGPQDLVFFDPDNGLEIKSTPYGSRDSMKYLYWQEVVEFYSLGHSLLIYQHFPREDHAAFIERICCELRDRTGAPEVHALRTSYVVYFLAVQQAHSVQITKALDQIAARWYRQIEVIQGQRHAR